MQTAHFTGIFITILIICLAGVLSTRMVKGSGDFIIGGRRLGPLLVFTGMVGAFAGGTVTIGTAQMGYLYGVCGLWFTLGAGAACLLLAAVLAGPLRKKEVDTISQFLSGFYGPGVKVPVAFFLGVGMFIQMTVQMLASAPLLASVFSVPPGAGIALFACLSAVLVVGGGFMSASVVGILKLVLLAGTMLVAGAASWSFLGGAVEIKRLAVEFQWFNVFPRGVFVELAGWMSVVIGFVSTQSFIQPIFAAKNVRAARLGSLLAAIALPAFGAVGALVGMYMRSAHSGIDPAAALPLFLLLHLPAWIGGVGVAALLVSLLLTASALALGIATLFTRDIYIMARPGACDREQLMAARGVLVVAVASSAVFGFYIKDDLILDWSYLSNALRGVTVFLPLMAAVFVKRSFPGRAGVWAVTVPPAAALVGAVFLPGTHPLYVGVTVSVLIMGTGLLFPNSINKLK